MGHSPLSPSRHWAVFCPVALLSGLSKQAHSEVSVKIDDIMVDEEYIQDCKWGMRDAQTTMVYEGLVARGMDERRETPPRTNCDCVDGTASGSGAQGCQVMSMRTKRTNVPWLGERSDMKSLQR